MENHDAGGASEADGGNSARAGQAAGTLRVERVQTGMRMEKGLLKVLKALAEYLDLTLGDLLEGIVLHAFEGKAPFGEETRRKIEELKGVYGLTLEAGDSHRLEEKNSPGFVAWDDLNDEDFMAAFHEGSMARQPFRHRHHIRIAWLLLSKEPLAVVAPEVRHGIGAIAAAHRKHDLYHETITQACLRLVAHRIAEGGPGEDWEAFRARNPELLLWPSPVLARHFSGALLSSAAARREFVPPDLAPLPPEPA